MADAAFPERTFAVVVALRRLARDAEAAGLLERFHDDLSMRERRPARIDYFATSLPSTQIFDERPEERGRTAATFLRAQDAALRGRHAEARALLAEADRRDPYLPMARHLHRYLESAGEPASSHPIKKETAS